MKYLLLFVLVWVPSLAHAQTPDRNLPVWASSAVRELLKTGLFMGAPYGMHTVWNREQSALCVRAGVVNCDEALRALLKQFATSGLDAIPADSKDADVLPFVRMMPHYLNLLDRLTTELAPELGADVPRLRKSMRETRSKMSIALEPCPDWARPAVWGLASAGIVGGYPGGGFVVPGKPDSR